MDALPITEDTGAEYASTNPGVMHACGHDGHTAIGLTVAKMLHAHREELAGNIKFCFQPSEEGTNGEEVGGALMMMRDGVLEFTESRKDPFAACMERQTARLDPCCQRSRHGRRGIVHRSNSPAKAGMAPHPKQPLIPSFAAAQIVTALQTIVSRNVAAA